MVALFGTRQLILSISVEISLSPSASWVNAVMPDSRNNCVENLGTLGEGENKCSLCEWYQLLLHTPILEMRPTFSQIESFFQKMLLPMTWTAPK